MEVVWNGNVNKIPFEVVGIGDTFIYNAEVYMRITNIYNQTDRIVNAVSIEDGIVVNFYDDEYVTPIKGKFIMD